MKALTVLSGPSGGAGSEKPLSLTYESLDSYLGALESLRPQELSREWAIEHGVEAPRLSKRLLLLGLAYKYQLRQAGKPLEKILREARERCLRTPCSHMHPGTKLVREWQGQVYEIDVCEQGFRFKDQTFGSLSAVARAITGVSRSGPLFFGVQSRER